jgi:hypothetical protein
MYVVARILMKVLMKYLMKNIWCFIDICKMYLLIKNNSKMAELWKKQKNVILKINSVISGTGLNSDGRRGSMRGGGNYARLWFKHAQDWFLHAE